MAMLWGAFLGAALLWALVAAYWLYTLGGVTGLAPLLGRPRQGLMLLGLVACGLGLLGDGTTPLTLAPVAAGALAFGYAQRRQWLFPAPATRLAATSLALAPEALVCVLPNGAAVPVAALARYRVAQHGELLLVCCGLARSLSAFRNPAQDLRAVLPHATGFDIGSAARRWDGVDGQPRDTGRPLTAVPIALRTVAAWRHDWPAASLLAAPGVKDALAWGLVTPEGWRSVDPAARAHHGAYLSRWAALGRGLKPR